MPPVRYSQEKDDETESGEGETVARVSVCVGGVVVIALMEPSAWPGAFLAYYH